MTTSVERWTKTSRVAMAVAALVLAILACGPALLSANSVDKLTTMFIYVILAVAWNALVGFCGLVSIGQQAFFGLGAYAAVRLADLGLSVYPSLLVAALLVRPARAAALLSHAAAQRRRVRNWHVGRLRACSSPRQSRYVGARRDWHVADSAQRLRNRDASSPDVLVGVGGDDRPAGNRVLVVAEPACAAIRAIRDNEEAAESIGVRVMSAKRLVFVLTAFGAALAGALWLATALTFQPKAYFSPLWTAYMIFMALVGGLGTFEGAILGAVVFFAIEAWFGAFGVWYLVGLGATALVFALAFPRGVWGWVENTALRLLPIGYRLRFAEDSSKTNA